MEQWMSAQCGPSINYLKQRFRKLFEDSMNINDLMKQAQQMQGKMAEMQEQAANAEVTGESGAGMVKVVMTGRHDVRKVTLDPSLMQENKEFLEDLLAAAVNDAVRKVEAQSKDALGKMTGGMDLPPGFKMPF
jgi:DNA-binding YbaB/EbfC family protein